jgi:hypothetical protein
MRNYKSSQLLNQTLNSRLNAKKIGVFNNADITTPNVPVQ